MDSLTDESSTDEPAANRGRPTHRRGNVSAGLLLFRRGREGTEVFLAHPGGPFWKKRDERAWSIPKGGVDPGEALLATAQREFEEETGIRPHAPFVALGHVKQGGGKIVHAWAWEGDADPSQITSNTMEIEWPRGSGKSIVVPEVDRCDWFTIEDARRRLIAAQSELLDRLLAMLEARAPSPQDP